MADWKSEIEEIRRGYAEREARLEAIVLPEYHPIIIRGKCRLRGLYAGHACYHHPKKKNLMVCGACGEAMEKDGTIVVLIPEEREKKSKKQ